MLRLIWPGLLIAATAWSGSAARAQDIPVSRPNVVLIVTDDLGYGDLSSYGATDVRTPNIDGIARDGLKLTDFYSNGATCTPTRAALISGRYQQRYALEAPLGSAGQADWERGLPANGRSLPDLLRSNGYATGLVGKWHLGWEDSVSPSAHGFDYFFGFKSGFIDYYQHSAGIDSPLRHDLFENDEPVKVAGYMTDLITERAVRFIELHADRPFFIDVSYSAPHWPYQVPGQPSIARDDARHLGPFDAQTSVRSDYVALIEHLDDGVGEILEALDRVGLRNRTIVIFTNDNGGEWLSRNEPFFHHKGSLWEGGIRVPTMIRWPGRVPAGSVSSQVGMTMDLTASILAATGSPVPAEARLEGENLFPVFEGLVPEIERTLYWRVGGPRPQMAVRSGKWKLVIDGTATGPSPRAMLFDLATDLSERTNLIAWNPEIASRLASILTGWTEDVDAEAASLVRS